MDNIGLIGVIKYKEMGGTVFHDGCPDSVCMMLNEIIDTGKRVSITYGCSETGRSWAGESKHFGYIKRKSRGIHTLMVSHTKRATGEPLLDSYIVRIDMVDQHDMFKSSVYKHKLYSGNE